jgi:hypothetical protein
VTNNNKIQEVQFYLDRSQDSLLAVLRSIVGNPRLQGDERLTALKLMGDFHHEVANFIWQKICEGESKGYEQASDHNAVVRQSARLDPQPKNQGIELEKTV